MAENNLLGKSHKQYVQDQIKVRQEILGKNTRDSKELSWRHGKTSWVRVASSIDIKNAIKFMTSPISIPITHQDFLEVWSECFFVLSNWYSDSFST